VIYICTKFLEIPLVYFPWWPMDR